MASNEKFSVTIEHGSDMVYDFKCTRCSEDERNSDGNYYCLDCLNCYCDTCLQLHNQLHRKHAVLGKSDVDKWTTATVLAGPLVRCEKHPGKLLELECMDHRQLCCSVCIGVDHKLCSAPIHVPEIAKGFHDSREFKAYPSTIAEIKKYLMNARQSLQDNKKAVEKSSDVCLQQIHTLRQQYNAIFDRLEQRTVSEIENGKSSVGGKIQTDVDIIDDVTERLQKLSDDLNDGGENNEATSYIGFAKCDDTIWKAKVLLQDVNKNDEYKLLFQPGNELTEFPSSLEMLGVVISDGGVKPLPGPDYRFKVDKHALHNVKVEDDKNICWIVGICKLATGEFLLADNNNLKLKLLDSSYKVISTCDVQEYPRDICLTGEREAAVAVDNGNKDRHEIHFFRVRSGTLLKTRTIKLQHPCIGLSHSSGALYITTNTDLHVYNIASDQSKKLYSDKTGLYTVHKCAVSPDGSRIYITNPTHDQLITLNKDGTKLSTLTHPELKYPTDAHVTSQGHVFVSCCDLHTVVQVAVMNDGKQTVTPLAGKGEGLNEPTSLCFNSSSDTLVVGLSLDDKIVELHMKD